MMGTSSWLLPQGLGSQTRFPFHTPSPREVIMYERSTPHIPSWILGHSGVVETPKDLGPSQISGELGNIPG